LDLGPSGRGLKGSENTVQRPQKWHNEHPLCSVWCGNSMMHAKIVAVLIFSNIRTPKKLKTTSAHAKKKCFSLDYQAFKRNFIS
jgi:hypothetical protein